MHKRTRPNLAESLGLARSVSQEDQTAAETAELDQQRAAYRESYERLGVPFDPAGLMAAVVAMLDQADSLRGAGTISEEAADVLLGFLGGAALVAGA